MRFAFNVLFTMRVNSYPLVEGCRSRIHEVHRGTSRVSGCGTARHMPQSQAGSAAGRQS